MQSCPSAQDLEAYYDGELNASRAVEVSRHVESCVECAGELRVLREMSQLFVSAPRHTLSDDALQRFHDDVDQHFRGERVILRYAEALSGVAAALLVASSLWLMRAPSDVPVAAGWEGTALTLQTADSTNRSSSHVETAEWIVSGLSN